MVFARDRGHSAAALKIGLVFSARLCFVLPMVLEVLPTRTGGAAENMALDFLLLQRYPRADVPRFRHYGWRSPAITFGYSQKIGFVRAQLPAGEHFDLCRRPTGGGVVDHRDDWTFSLVIPRGHPLEDVRATQSYREVHECLAAALQRQGIAAATKKAIGGTLRRHPRAHRRKDRGRGAETNQARPVVPRFALATRCRRPARR